MAGSTKNLPKLEDDACYETWKRDIEIWQELTDLPKPKQALAIHLSLSGKARVASSELGIADLKTDTGVETLLRKLDEIFLADKGRRQFLAFNNLYNYRRSEGKSIKDFITEFEHLNFQFKREDMELPGPVMAFMLLSAANLNETETHLVMSALNEVKYENMKSIIMRIFGTEIKLQSGNSFTPVEIKSEPSFVATDSVENSSFYVRGNRRFRGRGNTRGFFRGRGGRAGVTGANAEDVGGSRKLNPVSSNGDISRCLICDSKLHWARNCPHAYENQKKSEPNIDETEIVQLSLFMGLTNNENPHNAKLENLLQESKSCALLDTGCSMTVCGERWLEEYMGDLTEFQRSKISEENSDAKFTFGDGKTKASLKRVVIPCHIGGLTANITTDVVSCDIPLLLSAKSMKNCNMVWNFEKDSIQIGGKFITLRTTKSGHFLLPLSQ